MRVLRKKNDHDAVRLVGLNRRLEGCSFPFLLFYMHVRAFVRARVCVCSTHR
jgi:hypothetical protein